MVVLSAHPDVSLGIAKGQAESHRIKDGALAGVILSYEDVYAFVPMDGSFLDPTEVLNMKALQIYGDSSR